MSAEFPAEDYSQRSPEDDAYIKQLEDQLETAALHPGYIAKAGTDAQQAADYAEQLVALNASFTKISQENEALRETLRHLETEYRRAADAMRRKLDGKW